MSQPEPLHGGTDGPSTGGRSPTAEAPSCWTVAVITLFPELFDPFFETSLLGKAVSAGRLREYRVDPRDFTHDVHRTVDDAPFGGGAGMIMKPEPLTAAIRQARGLAPAEAPVLLLTPQGPPLTQRRVERYARLPGVVLLCGRYGGVDDRIRQTLVDEEVSIGDYVLSGGEVAAMVLIEAVSRLLPGVLGNQASAEDESFAQGLVEYPQFTRPAEWEGWAVPEVLRSGDHARIRQWRRAQALWRTRATRPDLWAALTLSAEDRTLMERFPPVDGSGEAEDG